MKKNILIAITIIVGIILITQTVNAAQPANPGKSGEKLPDPAVACDQPANAKNPHCVPKKDCPAGTYVIGYEDEEFQKPICKGEPTGCPYGENTPIDSPKCAPPVTEIPEPVVEPTTEEFVLTPDGGMKSTVTGEVFYGK